MFGRKNKNQISADYFARVDDNQLNFDDDLIQSIAEKTGSLATTWPNVSLGDLQTFLAQLEQDIVRASDRDLRIGTITYFQKNGNGKAEPNGLSWEDAVLTAGFENIVVSTAEHIFNSPAVRQDEQTDYEVILDALNPLIEAALETTDLTPQDMPVFPDAEAYRQARETDSPLEILAERFQAKPLNVAPELNKGVHVSSTSDTQNTFVEAVPEIPKPVEEVTLGTTDGEDDASKELVSDVDEAGRVDYRQEQGIIDHINLQPQVFPVDKVAKDLPAESPEYVQARLNADKVKANNFLTETSLMYTRKVRQTLAQHLKESQITLAKEVATIRDTDVLDTVKTQLESERSDEYAQRYELSKSARQKGFDADLAEEEQRHEQTVLHLRDSLARDLEALKVSVNQELDEWYLKRTQSMTKSLQQSMAQQIEDVTEQKQASLLTSMKALRDDLLTQHSQSLIALQEQLSQDIEKKRLSYQDTHDKAVLQATKLASAQGQAKSLSELESQIFTLKKQNDALEDDYKLKFDAKQAQISKLEQENNALQEATDTLKQAVADNPQASQSSDDLTQQLMALLAAQVATPKQTETQDDASKRSKVTGLAAFMIGSVSALIIGGTGLAAYTVGHSSVTTQNKTTSQSSSNQSSVTLQATSSSQSSSQDSSSSKMASSESSSVNPLTQKYHVGESVKATINGQEVIAQVSSIEDQAIILTYAGQNYKVDMQNSN